MLSMILAQPHSNETSLTGLQDVSGCEGRVGAGLLPIDAYTTLLDQSFRIRTRRRESRLDEGADKVLRVGDSALGKVVRNLTIAELAVEVVFGPCGRLRAVQPFDESPRQRGFGVSRLQAQHRVLRVRH